MKLWIDDTRPAPYGFYWIKTVNEAIAYIQEYFDEIEIIDLDHDAGDYVHWGGDYIQILNWLDMIHFNRPIKIHIHSMNPVGVQNMRAIIERNDWTEIY